MGKRAKLKMSFLAFLPKAATPVTFLSPPPSPSAGRGFSAPIVSLIPKEVRRRARHGSFDAREPTSPEVSCMGRIKNKRKGKVGKPHESVVAACPKVVLKGLVGKEGDEEKGVEACREAVPCLWQAKALASGRGVLKEFDWKAHTEENMIGDGATLVEARKEINLWQRRTISPPPPLQIS